MFRHVLMFLSPVHEMPFPSILEGLLRTQTPQAALWRHYVLSSSTDMRPWIVISDV